MNVTKMVSGSILPDDVVFPILMQVQMYGDILQKKAVDDDTVEYRRDSDQHKWCRGTVMREEKMMSFVYIAYPEGRSVTTRERVGWKSERIEP
jgi:PDZ domain-containing secreted protein